MLPSLPIKDFPDRPYFHAIKFCQAFWANTARIIRTNLSHAISSQLGEHRRFSNVGGSVFGPHVIHVVLAGPKEQMIRPDASQRTSVALVKNVSIRGNLSKVKNPRNAMRVLLAITTPEHTISKIMTRPNPQPTWPRLRAVCWNRAVFVDVSPKTFWETQRITLRQSGVLLKDLWHSVSFRPRFVYETAGADLTL